MNQENTTNYGETIFKVDWRSGQGSLDSQPPGPMHRYIKGPIPFDWMAKAASISKSAAKTALVLWFLRGLTRERRFRLVPARCREFGLDEKAKARGLKSLQEAGLIEVTANRGAAPFVEILEEGRA